MLSLDEIKYLAKKSKFIKIVFEYATSSINTSDCIKDELLNSGLVRDGYNVIFKEKEPIIFLLKEEEDCNISCSTDLYRNISGYTANFDISGLYNPKAISSIEVLNI